MCHFHDHGEVFDLVLLDLNLPDGSGLEVLHRAKELFDAALVAMMSATEDPHLIRNAIDAGACRYIPKTTKPAATVHALRLVLANGIYLPMNILLEMEGGVSNFTKEKERQQSGLSERQLAMLQRLLLGKPTRLLQESF